MTDFTTIPLFNHINQRKVNAEFDNRPAQANRVANYLDAHPKATAKEIDTACDVGCITKVLSDMPKLGYGLSKTWRTVRCDHGNRTRQVRAYTLLYRPETHPDLFTPA